MRFTKMHGIGNDYIYIETFTQNVDEAVKKDMVRAFSDRHFGIGGDGVIFINPSGEADCEMEMYNADGSRSEMCGNGIRCVGKFIYDQGFTDKTEIEVISAGKVRGLKMKIVKEEPNRFTGLTYGKREDGMVVGEVTVNMGEAILKPGEIPVDLKKTGDIITNDISAEKPEICIMQPVRTARAEYRMTCVSMGNPHAVIFVDDPETFPLETEGPELEKHECFPNKANIEFVKVLDRNNVQMRVWERGTGETFACGTGACAVAVACILNGFCDDKITVHLRGGDLSITWDRDANRVFMTGGATTVCTGAV